MRLDDLDHVDVGHVLGQQALERHHATREHRHNARQFNIVLARQVHQRSQKLADIQVLKIEARKVGNDKIQIGQKGRMIELSRIAARHSEAHERILELGHVALGHGENHVLDDTAVVARHAPDHTQVDKVNDTVLEDDVSRMRIGMEKAIVEHLRRVVLDNRGANLLQVVTLGHQALGIGDRDAIDVIHDHDMLGTQIQVGLGARNAADALMELIEVVEVLGLGQKVGLLAKRGPQLLDDGVQVNELVGVDELGDDAHHRADDVDVLRHDLLRAGTLHLDGHVLARHQTGAVHLRKRRTTERIGVDRVEHLPQALTVLFLQAAKHHLVRYGLHIGTQATELVAKTLRQNLGAVGQNLAHLDEHGAKLFEQTTQTHRRKVVPHAVLFDQADDLPDALATTGGRKLVLLARRHGIGLFGHHVNGTRLLACARDGGLDLVDNRRLVTQGILIVVIGGGICHLRCYSASSASSASSGSTDSTGTEVTLSSTESTMSRTWARKAVRSGAVMTRTRARMSSSSTRWAAVSPCMPRRSVRSEMVPPACSNMSDTLRAMSGVPASLRTCSPLVLRSSRTFLLPSTATAAAPKPTLMAPLTS